MLQEVSKKKAKGSGQQMLAEAFQNMVKPTVFSRQVVLKAVAKFVVCDDQVSVAAWLCNGIHHNDLTRALQSQARSGSRTAL